jgi:sirohydrochlorin cobaltochelatase
MSAIRDFLQQRLDTGEWSIGQLSVAGTTVRHSDDQNVTDLEIFKRPEDARELAKFDDDGNYRPLKTAPNLRHGWRLELASVDELRLALDLFYPAAIGTWLAYANGKLSAVPFRDTLGRQSGMYRVTQLITNEQATGVIEKICAEGCIRHRLWGMESQVENRKSKIENYDILCAEACNLLVAACRPVAKQNLPEAGPRP